jgi:transposase
MTRVQLTLTYPIKFIVPQYKGVTMIFIGIDIAKLSFDVAVLRDGHYHSRQFKNVPAGFSQLSKWVSSFKQPAYFCLEATGIYGLALAKHCHKSNQKIIVANPIQTHAFAKMEMARNKTDKADSMSIARYCQHIFNQGAIDKRLFVPKSAAFERVQFLVTRLDQLNKMKSQENNRLGVSLDKMAARSIKSMLTYIDKQITAIKKEIAIIVKQDEQLTTQFNLLISIRGIADKTAWALLAYIGDINLFDNAKQISSYAGLNPSIDQSGTSINRSRLSKMGCARLRKSLYMPALVAARFNPIMLAFYNKLLSKGKPKKVALVAVMRKLLVLAYGVLKSGKPFDVNHQISTNLA